MTKVVVAIYTDPDYYPPTLNAILNLAGRFGEVVVVTRNNAQTDYPFPSNVRLVKSGKYIAVAEAEIKGVGYKLISFLKFVRKLYLSIIRGKTDLLILYDPFPLLAFALVRKFIPARILSWYHNHDMPELSLNRKYSLGWYAAAKEHETMKYIGYFSLPSSDRLRFYPNWQRPLDYFFIPNYPSLKVYRLRPLRKGLKDNLKLIFQGAIGEGHALEELISLLGGEFNGFSLQLVLKGPVREPYKEKLNRLAAEKGVSEKLTWIGIGPYAGVPVITSSCHIGIAIHKGTDNVSRTLGTASNKIYEYAACGLPVILYDDAQFRDCLKGYQWAYFTDGSIGGLSETLQRVIQEIDESGELAFHDFRESLNFEKAFLPALDMVMKAGAGS